MTPIERIKELKDLMVGSSAIKSEINTIRYFEKRNGWKEALESVQVLIKTKRFNFNFENKKYITLPGVGEEISKWQEELKK